MSKVFSAAGININDRSSTKIEEISLDKTKGED